MKCFSNICNRNLRCRYDIYNDFNNITIILFFLQNYLMEHNTRYIDLYLGAQQDYIVQVEKELLSNQSILEQMQSVAT